MKQMMSQAAGQVGDAFTTLSTLNLSLRNLPVDATSRWYIQVHDRSHAAMQQTVDAIQQRVHSANGADGSVDAPALAPQQGPGVLLVIYSLFDTVAVLVALVGLLGLSHTLSASVLERRFSVLLERRGGVSAWFSGLRAWHSR
jgi:hypothetical protein